MAIYEENRQIVLEDRRSLTRQPIRRCEDERSVAKRATRSARRRRFEAEHAAAASAGRVDSSSLSDDEDE